MSYEQFHRRVEDLISHGETLDHAIELAAWETDHPGEAAVKGGTCTLCEDDASELVPWATRERLCWHCVDIQLDLLAKAVRDIMPVEIGTDSHGHGDYHLTGATR